MLLRLSASKRKRARQRMSNYDSLAMYYDVLTRDVDYSRIADFYELLFDKYGIHPGLMLDLACGTDRRRHVG